MKNWLVRDKSKHSSLTATMKTNIHKRNDPVVARRFVTWGVMISTVMVGLSLFVSIYFDSERVAERKLAELATTYYETYYHEKFMKTIDPDFKDEKLETYGRTGLQPVLLRQLLLYQNGKYAEYKQYFEKDGFNCDKNLTSATFYPVEPYGPKDYRVEYKLECEGK